MIVAALMLTHGVPKLVNFESIVTTFPDPIGLGPETSLMLVIGAEVGCSLLLFFGLLTRVAAIPLLITMTVAIVHTVYTAEESFRTVELPFLYWTAFLCILLAGPGAPSIDRWAAEGIARFRKKKQPPPQHRVPPVPRVAASAASRYIDPDATSEEVNLTEWDTTKAS